MWEFRSRCNRVPRASSRSSAPGKIISVIQLNSLIAGCEGNSAGSRPGAQPAFNPFPRVHLGLALEQICWAWLCSALGCSCWDRALCSGVIARDFGKSWWQRVCDPSGHCSLEGDPAHGRQGWIRRSLRCFPTQTSL